MLGRGVTHSDDALAQHDATGRAVGEIAARCRHLLRESKGIRRACAIDLQPRAGLSHQCLRNDVRRRRKWAELWMDCGKIIQATDEAAKLPLRYQSRKGLINGSACTDVHKVARREDAPPPASASASHDLIWHRKSADRHMSENTIRFSHIQRVRLATAAHLCGFAGAPAPQNVHGRTPPAEHRTTRTRRAPGARTRVCGERGSRCRRSPACIRARARHNRRRATTSRPCRSVRVRLS